MPQTGCAGPGHPSRASWVSLVHSQHNRVINRGSTSLIHNNNAIIANLPLQEVPIKWYSSSRRPCQFRHISFCQQVFFPLSQLLYPRNNDTNFDKNQNFNEYALRKCTLFPGYKYKSAYNTREKHCYPSASLPECRAATHRAVCP